MYKMWRIFIILIATSLLLPLINNPEFQRNSHSADFTDSLEQLSIFDLSHSIQTLEHKPIIISNDGDFSTQALAEAWEGNGTSSNPYIISGYDITPNMTHGIEITGTTHYFVIEDCYFNGFVGTMDRAIYLNNIRNGNISYNRIENSSAGIVLQSSEDNLIQNNAIELQVSPSNAIFLTSSRDNVITENQIEGGYHGISVLYGSENNLVTGNSVRNTESMAISGISNSVGNNITYNAITNSRIYSRNVNYSRYEYNIIYGPDGGEGLYFQTSSHNLVQNNSFTNCPGKIYVTGGIDNLFQFNDFTNNGYIVNDGQIEDTSSTNNFSLNYWNDWTGPDTNSDGIVDIPYVSHGATDTKPSTRPHRWSPVSFSSILPNLTIANEFNLSWTPYSDSLFPSSHPLYNSALVSNLTLSYSLDGGTTWVGFGSVNPASQWFIWDTKSVPDGRFLVQLSTTTFDGQSLVITSIPFDIDNEYAPTIAFTSPVGTNLTLRRQVNITWIANDIDGDSLRFTVEIWNNISWTILAENQTEQWFNWFSTDVNDGDFFQLRISAFDGILTTYTYSDTFSLENYPKSLPTLTFTNPIFTINNTIRGYVNMSWTASDPDGDPMKFTIDYYDVINPNGSIILSEAQSDTWFVIDTTSFPDGLYRFTVHIVTYFNDPAGWNIARFYTTFLTINNTNSPPSGIFLSPTSPITIDTQLEIHWNATDFESQPLVYSVGYFLDANPTLIYWIAQNSSVTSVDWNATSVPEGSYHIILRVSDGIDSFEIISDLVEVKHPSTETTSTTTTSPNTSTDPMSTTSSETTTDPPSNITPGFSLVLGFVAFGLYLIAKSRSNR